VARRTTASGSRDGEADPQRSGAQAVERAVSVLLAFTGDERDLGLVEIAERVGLSPSTTHRLVRAMCGAGILGQDDRTDRYFLGPTIAVLGSLARDRLGYGAVQPLLDELAELTGESANFGVRQGDEIVVVVHATSPAPLRFDQGPGARIPIHASAMGKAVLAFAPDPGAEVERLELVAFTPRTITRREQLRRELADVRRLGYACNDEERNVGVRAVGAPVVAPGGALAGAISVQGPSVRLTPARMADLGAQVRAAADRLGPLVPIVARAR
jgi:IclR family acetate operon transcriptional repressor